MTMVVIRRDVSFIFHPTGERVLTAEHVTEELLYFKIITLVSQQLYLPTNDLRSIYMCGKRDLSGDLPELLSSDICNK